MGAGQDYAFLGNLKFKGDNYEEADRHFDNAAQCFSDTKSLVNLVQLHMTVAKLNLIESRKEPTQTNLEKAKQAAKELGDPESLLKSIGELEAMLEKLDKI